MVVAGEVHELHGRQLPAPFTGLVLVLLMASLDSTSRDGAPHHRGDLGGLNHIAWVATAYLLGAVVPVGSGLD